MVRLSLIVLLLLTHMIVRGQKKSYLSAGVAAYAYNGELSTYASWSPGIHLSALLNPTKKLNGSVTFALGSFTGENNSFGFPSTIGTPTPNSFVKTNFVRLNYALRYNLLERKKVMAYVSLGAGFIRFTPKDDLGEDLEPQDNTRQENETYRNLSFILPTTLGVVYFFPNRFAVNLEFGLLNSTTDYLDNISELGDSGNDNLANLNLSLLLPLVKSKE